MCLMFERSFHPWTQKRKKLITKQRSYNIFLNSQPVHGGVLFGGSQKLSVVFYQKNMDGHVIKEGARELKNGHEMQWDLAGCSDSHQKLVLSQNSSKIKEVYPYRCLYRYLSGEMFLPKTPQNPKRSI